MSGLEFIIILGWLIFPPLFMASCALIYFYRYQSNMVGLIQAIILLSLISISLTLMSPAKIGNVYLGARDTPFLWAPLTFIAVIVSFPIAIWWVKRTPNINVGDRVYLSGGHENEPQWLVGNDGYYGYVKEFIPGSNHMPAAVVKLDQPIKFNNIASDIVVLELRYVGAKWLDKGIVHVELGDSTPEAMTRQNRHQENHIESHATYMKV